MSRRAPRTARHRRSRGALTAGVILAALVLSVLGYIAGQSARPALDEARATPPVAARLAPGEAAYFTFVAPRLHALAGEAQILADLGNQKSRNLLKLQTHGQRLTELVQQVRAYGLEHGVPDRFVAADSAFQSGSVQAEDGMEEARQGFLHLDWERVQRATQLFNQGSRSLASAAHELDTEAAAGGERHELLAVPLRRHRRFSHSSGRHEARPARRWHREC